MPWWRSSVQPASLPMSWYPIQAVLPNEALERVSVSLAVRGGEVAAVNRDARVLGITHGHGVVHEHVRAYATKIQLEMGRRARQASQVGEALGEHWKMGRQVETRGRGG